MGIEVGKIAVIFDDSPRLAAVWKGEIREARAIENPFPFSGGGSDGGGPGPSFPPNVNRPQLADIVFKGFETYDDSSKTQRVKAKFRIYNSSDEEIDGFLYTLTISDTQGGRS